MKPIRLAISTCPNDTFAFHAILNGRIDLNGLEFDIRLLDINQLNSGLAAGEYDVAKASFNAAFKLASRYWILSCGAALGFGNGPVLLAREPKSQPTDDSQLTLCPGAETTASLLYQLFYGNTRVEQVVFSQIMPMLHQGQADFGVCIHEGRFTYADAGLYLVQDLGALWEQQTHLPLPLGGILAAKHLPQATIRQVHNAIQMSIQYARRNRQETLPTMRRYAQELSDEVLFQHVDLYINDYTLDMGQTGRDALNALCPVGGTVAIWR